jgi:hypothetical protein
MKWDEIISLNEEFIPTCDIKNENSFYWKQFICHQNFYKLLKNSLDMYQNRQKAIWIQGTYGSGKTHATMVIKALLSLPLEEINEYIEHSIDDSMLRHRILNLKKDSFKTFPIVLKGGYHITESKSFEFAIQQEVIDALQKAGISNIIKTSFNTILNHIEKSPIFWNDIINNSELQFEIDNDIKILKDRLQQYDNSILKLCEDELKKQNIHIGVTNIVNFLEEVSNIIQKYGYNHITIFWDEFTSVLETNNYLDIFTSLQNITENISNGNVFLYIISHRTIDINILY